MNQRPVKTWHEDPSEARERVLVVIPCLNEAGHIGPLVMKLLDDPATTTLVVADGGSTDGTREIVRDAIAASKASGLGRPALHLLDNPDRIQSAAVNLAVARFGHGHRFLVRVDAHCDYSEGYVSTLVSSARRMDAGSVVVPMITVGNGGFQDAVAAAQNSVLGTGGSAHRHVGEGRYVEHGHHALMELEAFRSIGGYCQNMPCNEDAELDHRLGRAGYRIWLAPEAAITYFPRSTPMQLWRQYWKYGKGRAHTLMRHRLRPRLRQLLPLAVPIAIAMLPLAVLHPVFAVPALAWLTACLVVGAWLGVKSKRSWAFASGVSAALMHAAWGFGFLHAWLSRRPPVPRHGFQPGSAS